MFDSNELELLSGVKARTADDRSASTVQATTSVARESGRRTWLGLLGFAALALVAWVTLASGQQAPENADEVPAADTDLDDEGAGLQPVVGESVTAARAGARTQSPVFFARTADGESALEAVGEELAFSVVVDVVGSAIFINPNNGSASSVPVGPATIEYLSSTHSVQLSWVGGRFSVIATDLFRVGPNELILGEVDPNVEVFPGPSSDQVWLTSGAAATRDLVDLNSGGILASVPFNRFDVPVTWSPIEVLSPFAGGVYERDRASVVHLTDGRALAASEDLLLVERCDAALVCGPVWLDRQTLEALDFPAPTEDLRRGVIDPTSRWFIGLGRLPGKTTIQEIATGRTVVELGELYEIPIFSPDGRWLAIGEGSSTVELMHVETGTEFTVYAAPYALAWGSTVFFPLDYAGG